MRALALNLITATMLAACDDSQPTQPQQPIVVRSEAQDELHKLSDDMRHIALKRAILDSGLACQRVTGSGYVREYQNLSMWTARCDEGTDWAIFVGPDGSAQVRPCKDVAELNLPACAVKADQPRPAAGNATINRSGV